MSVDQQIPMRQPPPTDVADYHPLSGAAVVGLILGILAPTAMLHPLMWLLPAAGVAVNLLALRQIAHNAPHMLGRKAAWAGLLLSLCFGTAGVSEWLVQRALIRREAREAALTWFSHLADDQPHLAYWMTTFPPYQPADANAASEFYRDNPEQLEAFVERPPVRTLLALGRKARVHYYGTDGQGPIDDRYQIYQVYAVTHEEAGEKKTFFVGLELQRFTLRDGQTAWRVASATDDVVPEESAQPQGGDSPTPPSRGA